MLLLHEDAADDLSHNEDDGYDQSYHFEALEIVSASEHANQEHGSHGDESGAYASAGTAYYGEVLSVFRGIGHCRNHAPVRDVHHGVRNAPEDVDHCKIYHESGFFCEFRRCKECVEHYSVQNGT